MSEIAVSAYKSPVGWVRLKASDKGLQAITFVEGPPADADPSTSQPHLVIGIAALRAYFDGGPLPEVSFDMVGTPFQIQVWRALQEIPFGKTWSYKELAIHLGDAKKVRAVGMANNKNPLSILVPCHRVIGADGKLVGYASGLERKRWLLDHEGAPLPAYAQMTLF